MRNANVVFVGLEQFCPEWWTYVSEKLAIFLCWVLIILTVWEAAARRQLSSFFHCRVDFYSWDHFYFWRYLFTNTSASEIVYRSQRMVTKHRNLSVVNKVGINLPLFTWWNRMGERIIASLTLMLCTEMYVSGKVHSLASLLPRKYLPFPIE